MLILVCHKHLLHKEMLSFLLFSLKNAYSVMHWFHLFCFWNIDQCVRRPQRLWAHASPVTSDRGSGPGLRFHIARCHQAGDLLLLIPVGCESWATGQCDLPASLNCHVLNTCYCSYYRHYYLQSQFDIFPKRRSFLERFYFNLIFRESL